MRDRYRLIDAKFYVLLALAEGPKHGLAVQEQIVGDTVGTYLRTSTVYAVIQALVRHGLVEPVGGVGYRKDYQLTVVGRRALKLEAQTLKRAVQLGLERTNI